MSTIMATVSPRILSKAGRLFSNTLSDILIELFQNARRAGATRVDVNLRALEKETTEISVSDNGSGIDDFSTLLCMGASDWDASMEAKEDPAGMGFFSLLHSGVTVISNGKKAVITTEAFEGKIPVNVDSVSLQNNGTTIIFQRKDVTSIVKEAVQRTAKYGSIDVFVDGQSVPREDFLENALYIKECFGVRIGVFEASANSQYFDTWNFHGKTIREHSGIKGLSSVIPMKGAQSLMSFTDINVRFDVIETSSIHLKLPDRNGIVYDEQHARIAKEARRAMFEYVASLPEHTASYEDYLEAATLGISLREAAPYFTTFSARAADSYTTEECFLGSKDVVCLTSNIDTVRYAFVDTDSPMCTEWLLFTMDVASKSFVKDVPFTLLEDKKRFKGYDWYSKIPKVFPTCLSVNGEIFKNEYQGSSGLQVVDNIKLGIQLCTAGNDEVIWWNLPFAGWYEYNNFPSMAMIVTPASPWLTEGADTPFELQDAAVYVGFICGDDVECDSYDTQLEYFIREVDAEITQILHGPLGLVRLKLGKLQSDMNLEYRNCLKSAGVSKVVFELDQDNNWSLTIQTSEKPASDAVAG